MNVGDVALNAKWAAFPRRLRGALYAYITSDDNGNSPLRGFNDPDATMVGRFLVIALGDHRAYDGYSLSAIIDLIRVDGGDPGGLSVNEKTDLKNLLFDKMNELAPNNG